MKHRRKTARLPFLALPYYVLQNHAFRTLSPPATKLLLAVGGRFRGDNNGELEMPFGELVRDWHYNSRHTIARALRELFDANLLIRTRQGRSYGSPHPSLYALGWHPIPASDLHSVHEISPRLAPQVLNASAPRALAKPKQVHPEHLEGPKMPFSSKPGNGVMRGLQVHRDPEQVHPEHYLSRSMPGGHGLCARSPQEKLASISDALVLSECSIQKTARACVPIGGAKVTTAQLAYLAAKPKTWPAVGTPEYDALVAKYCYFDIPLRDLAAA